MIWSPSRKLCFIHIPKTGGTSIEIAYEPQIRFGDVMLAAWRLGLDVSYGKYLHVGKHSPAIRIAQLVGRQEFNACFSFAVVRDPVDRMVSYYNCIHSYNHTGPYEIALKAIADFADFVEATAPRFSSQALLVLDPQAQEVMVSRLIPYPRLEEGWRQICDMFGLDAPLPHVNASRPVALEVSDEARALVRRLYAVDCDLMTQAEVAFTTEEATGYARPAAAVES